MRFESPRSVSSWSCYIDKSTIIFTIWLESQGRLGGFKGKGPAFDQPGTVEAGSAASTQPKFRLTHYPFLDDRDVERVAVQKFEPQLDWSFVMPSEVLSTALDGTPPIVYICVADDLTWRRLP